MVIRIRSQKTFFYFFLTFIFFDQTLVGQLFYTAEKINTDSLGEVLQNSAGEKRIPILNKLASAYFYSDPERSLGYALEADSLLPESADLPLYFDTRIALGTAWMSLGNYPEAIPILLDAYETAKSSGRLDLRFSSGKLIILTFLYTRNYETAEKMLNDFMQFDTSKVPGNLLFEIMVSVAWAHWSFLGNYEKALMFQHVCLGVSDTVPVRKPNLALCYYQMGICQHNLERYDSAEYYFRIGNDICEKYNIGSLEQYHSKYVITLCRLGRYREALKKIEELTSLTEKRKRYLPVADNYQVWGEILAELGKPEEAIGKFEKALENGEWVKANKTLSSDSAYNIDYWYSPGQNVKVYVEEMGMRIVRNAHFSLYKEYDKLQNHAKALFHYVKYEEEKSLMTQLERSKMAMELETRYQTRKKEQHILNLAEQNQVKEEKLRLRELLLIVVISFMVVIVILAVVLVRQFRLKSIHRTLVTEQRLLRSQMNPHFIFNTLANIQTFILSEDPFQASRYLAKFSKLVRNIFDNSLEEYITLDKELETIEHYLYLQKIRYAGKFDFTISLDENIVPEEFYIPPMLGQPFIENAIEHGIRHKEGGGRIDIELKKFPDGLHVMITDNGVGREKAKEIESVQKPTHRSMATSITTDRLKILNRKSKKQIIFEISDLHDEAGNALGTSVKFVFPL